MLLSDVNFAHDDAKQCVVDQKTWTIITAGKVAIALDEKATTAWNKGGQSQQVGHPKTGRALMVHLPRQDIRKG